MLLNHVVVHTLGGCGYPFLSNIVIMIQGLRSGIIISFVKFIICVARKYKENSVTTEHPNYQDVQTMKLVNVCDRNNVVRFPVG